MIRLDITNDGTGSRQRHQGNYEVELTMPDEKRHGYVITVRTRVEHFNREERVFALMRRAIDKLEEDAGL